MHSIARGGAAAPASQSPTTSTPRRVAEEEEPKKKKKVGIRVETDSDNSGNEATRTINEDEHNDEYAGKWKKVVKGKNSRLTAVEDDQIRPFGRLVPNWP